MTKEETYAVVKLSDVVEVDDGDGGTWRMIKRSATVALVDIGGVSDAVDVVGVIKTLGEMAREEYLRKCMERDEAAESGAEAEG